MANTITMKTNTQIKLCRHLKVEINL